MEIEIIDSEDIGGVELEIENYIEEHQDFDDADVEALLADAAATDVEGQMAEDEGAAVVDAVAEGQQEPMEGAEGGDSDEDMEPPEHVCPDMEEQAFFYCVGSLAEEYHRRFPDIPGMDGRIGYPESRKPVHLQCVPKFQ